MASPRIDEAGLAGACEQAARRLFEHVRARHIRPDGALVGPDPGVRATLRIGALRQSYLRALPWWDRLYYLQAQAYWILDALALHRMTDEPEHLECAVRCAEVVASRQTDEGWWDYPQIEWRGRVATVEGCFGALAMLAAFEVEPDQRFLAGAKRWYEFMVARIGFQRYDADSLAVNYFSSVGRGLIRNNSTLALWFVSALARSAGDERYLEYAAPMLSFVERCQLDTGELPYAVAGEGGPGRDHYLCYQYNAFQFLDLYEYHRNTGDARAANVMRKLAGFLAGGLTQAGDARHDCDADRPIIHYFTAVVGAALLAASQLGLGDYREGAMRGYRRLLDVQRADGGFDYSWGDYGLLADRRSYPRNQAMILRHLLIAAGAS